MRRLRPAPTRAIKVNLHGHSTYSDGAASPQWIASLAERKRRFLGITDHNTAAAHKETNSRYIIAGIEVTTAENIDVLLYGDRDQVIAFDETEVQPHTDEWSRYGLPIRRDLMDILQTAHDADLKIVMPHYDIEGGLGDLDLQTQHSIVQKFPVVMELNGQCSRPQNRQARNFASVTNTPLVAASDAHVQREWMGAHTKLRIPKDTEVTVESIFNAIRSGKARNKFSVREPSWYDWMETASHVLKTHGISNSWHLIRGKLGRLLSRRERLALPDNSLQKLPE